MVVDEGNGFPGAIGNYRVVASELSQIIVERIAVILQLVAKREVERGHLIVRQSVDFGEPLLNALAVFPVFADHKGPEFLVVFDVAILGYCAYDPSAVAFDGVEAETVKAQFLEDFVMGIPGLNLLGI